MATRVLVVYGSESGTCKRVATTMAKEWAARDKPNFEIVNVLDGMALTKELSLVEDDNNDKYFDLTSLRQKYDVLVVITSSYGEGDPPENFGPFFLALLSAVGHGNKPLAGMQHAVLGQGSTVYQETFQNCPRLTDRYLGECGSRRFAMRQEIDAAHYIEGNQHVTDRKHFQDVVFESLQALPSASAPPVCEWGQARASHAFPQDKITLKSAQDLAEFRARSNGSNDQAIGMLFWAAVALVPVAYSYYLKFAETTSP